jgi:hypothetical protein
MTDADPDPTRVEQATTVFRPVGDEGGGGGYVPPTGGTPPVAPPPDRRPWIIAGLLALIVVMLIVLLLMQDDDDGDDVSATSSTTELTTSTSSTSTTVTTTTTTAAPTTTDAPIVTVPPSQCKTAGSGPMKPGLAAQTVYDAWVRGDKACAAEIMTPAALAELFSRDGTDAHDDFVECTEQALPDPHTDCQFHYDGGATDYLMTFSNTKGWQVYDITQVAD